MEALKNLVANIPDWSKRLDELSTEIDKRQLELAQIESQTPPRPKSVRNRGSTESLKPKDDPGAGPGNLCDAEGQTTTTSGIRPSSREQQTRSTTLVESHPNGTSPTSPSSPQMPAPVLTTALALSQQTHQAKAVAQAKARATVRRRHRSDSVISAEGATPKYRTRSMIIVYYDSYVQSFFEELVRFVSASRNLMRKAKMAAKVAQIKRLAELELPDPEPPKPRDGKAPEGTIDVDPANGLVPDANGSAPEENGALPTLNFRSTRAMRNMSRTSALLAASRGSGYTGATSSLSMAMGRMQQPPDVYDELDKALEYVQSMCEHAAHQFLRDGDCNEEIDNVKRRLGETRETADKELARVKKDDPVEEAGEEEGVTKFRSFRPVSFRREVVGDEEKKDKMEVDEGIDDMEGEAPNLVFKSTRVMR